MPMASWNLFYKRFQFQHQGYTELHTGRTSHAQFYGIFSAGCSFNKFQSVLSSNEPWNIGSTSWVTELGLKNQGSIGAFWGWVSFKDSYVFLSLMMILAFSCN